MPALIRGGGQIPERGVSIEEFWLGFQLLLRSPVTCFLNAAQPQQEVARITRLRRLSAAEIWAELQQVYANPELERPLPTMIAGLKALPTFVYDGSEIAHIISAYTIQENELHFMDPWPERSLLCAEHNSAGVAARESNLIRHGWQITRQEFKRVVFAVLLHPLTCVLTKQEYEAARTRTLALEIARTMNRNRPSSKPIEGVRISRLTCAALINCVWEVKVAINEGDDLNERGKDGATALHVAAEKGHLEIVKLLAKHGADCHAHNAEGKTPAEVATAEGNTAVAEYLESLG